MKLLVGVDIHERPEVFLRVVAAWARRLGARMDLAFASPYHPDDVRLEEATDVLKAQVAEWRRVQAEELAELERLLGTLPPELRGEARLLRGNPGDVFAVAASAYELAVVGTHGRVGLARAFLGSVAEEVVRRAASSVLVVRLDAVPLRVPERPTALAPLAWPVGDGEGLAALRRWLGDPLEVHAVHVVSRAPWQVPHDDPTLDLPQNRALRDDMVRRELERVAARAGYGDAALHVVDAAGDDVSEDVLALAERVVADLIVLPTHGRRGVARLALGSVAERIVRRAECAVLVTRFNPPEVP